MLGYVKTYTPELKIIEDKYYKSAYCGLCHTLKKLTGQRSRMLLSYDFTYLVLVRLAAAKEKPEFEQNRCCVHPFGKKLVMKSNNATEFAAYAGILLAYHKMCDDIADEKGKKRLKAYFARMFFKKAYKSAQEKFPGLDSLLSEKLLQLHEIETSKVASVDTPAGIFGELMATVFSYGLEGEASRLSAEIGYATGKWIYIIDAIDDFDDDLALKRYNPFVLLFEGAAIDREKKDDVEAALMRVLDRARNAIDLVDFGNRRDLGGLIGNILNQGMPRMAKSILEDMRSEKNEDFAGQNDSQLPS